MACEECGAPLETYNVEDHGEVIVKTVGCTNTDCNAAWEIEYEITDKIRVN